MEVRRLRKSLCLSEVGPRPAVTFVFTGRGRRKLLIVINIFVFAEDLLNGAH